MSWLVPSCFRLNFPLLLDYLTDALGCRKDIGHLRLPISKYGRYGTLFDPPFITVEEAFKGLPQAEFSRPRIKSTFVTNSGIMTQIT
jgi:hypothetical protein